MTVIFFERLCLATILDMVIRGPQMQNNMQHWIPRTRKPLKRHILQHSVTIIKKIQNGFWRQT